MPESASVECIECNQLLGQVSALGRQELCALVGSLVAACHAAVPHCSHRLRANLPAIPGDARELTIECLHPSCEALPPMKTTCPIELVAAITLVFHTAHEGHALRLTYDDNTWSSPHRP